MRNALCFFVVAAICAPIFAQTDSSKIQFSGYIETYYGFDFNRPFDGKRPSYIYSHNRHNEFNLNIGLFRAAYQGKGVRGNLGLMAGTYAEANLAAEPAALRHVFEANAGIKLSDKHEIWLDAGIFPSHIGMESAIGKDCWALTRSLAADNSPYYEAGAKLTFSSPDGDWLFSGLVLNGWQNIARPTPSYPLAFGTQVQWKPIKRLTLNNSTFFGTMRNLIGLKSRRLFQNFYAVFEATPKLGFGASFDYGVQIPLENLQLPDTKTNRWQNGQFLARYAFSKKISATARAEFFNDKDNIILQAFTDNCDCLGFSANLDFAPRKNSLLRFEVKTTRTAGQWNISLGKPQQEFSEVATIVLATWF